MDFFNQGLMAVQKILKQSGISGARPFLGRTTRVNTLKMSSFYYLSTQVPGTTPAIMQAWIVALPLRLPASHCP
jgi:hypothetical protein